MSAIDTLTELIAEFPGVGPRQARRIVQYLLGRDQRFREELSGHIASIRKSVSQCGECFRYADNVVKGRCSICADEARDAATLMVVEKDVDIDGVEASGAYRGRYFVLGGLIPMARQRRNGNGARVKELLSRIAQGGLSEVIFALSATPEGDYTARELMKQALEADPKLKATLLGRGLSIGAEIEYADSETLRSALKNRAEGAV